MNSAPSEPPNRPAESSATGEILERENFPKADGRETRVTQMWSAPLPPPGAFNKYPESIQNRIMNLVEKENEYRRDLDNKAMDANVAAMQKKMDAEIEADRRGQTYTFVLVSLVVVVSGILVWGGHTWGLSILIVGVIAALNPFIEKLKDMFSSGKKENRDEHSN